MPNRSRIRFILVLILWGLGSAAVEALPQGFKSGPQVLTFFSDVDDTEQPYAIYLPKDFNAKKKVPLVISLHGAGSNHRLNLRRVFGKSNAEGENDVEASRYFPAWDDVDVIVASPLARGTMGYQGLAEKDVYDVLADVKSRFPIDEDRVYLTGLSMGGGGTLWLGLTRPDVWAALAPVCPAPPGEANDLALNALNLPVHFFQGGADPVVKPEGTQTPRVRDERPLQRVPRRGAQQLGGSLQGRGCLQVVRQAPPQPFPRSGPLRHVSL
jgi:predicted peptidase